MTAAVKMLCIQFLPEPSLFHSRESWYRFDTISESGADADVIGHRPCVSCPDSLDGLIVTFLLHSRCGVVCFFHPCLYLTPI